MSFILVITFLFFIWVGYKLVTLLAEEIERQRNPLQAAQKDGWQNNARFNHRRASRSRQAWVKVPDSPLQLIHANRRNGSSSFKQEPQITVHYKTQERLYRLVNGDMKTARRLIDGVRERNPHQSNQWVWEKVIVDLERDRRV